MRSCESSEKNKTVFDYFYYLMICRNGSSNFRWYTLYIVCHFSRSYVLLHHDGVGTRSWRDDCAKRFEIYLPLRTRTSVESVYRKNLIDTPGNTTCPRRATKRITNSRFTTTADNLVWSVLVFRTFAVPVRPSRTTRRAWTVFLRYG